MAIEDSSIDRVAACVRKVETASHDNSWSLRTRIAELEAGLQALKLALNASNKQMKAWCRYLGVCPCNCRCYYCDLRRVLRARRNPPAVHHHWPGL